MNEALVVLLGLIWALVLLPSAIRSRRSNTHATVGGFEHAMNVLRSRPDGRYVMVPDDAARIVGPGGHGPETPREGGVAVVDRPEVATRPARSEDPVLERRRQLFTRLVGTAGALFALSLLFGGAMWLLFGASVAMLGSYVALLLRYKSQREEAERVVRRLHRDPETQRNQQALQRAVGHQGWQVARHPDDPWDDGAGVRIRRWDD